MKVVVSMGDVVQVDGLSEEQINFGWETRQPARASLLHGWDDRRGCRGGPTDACPNVVPRWVGEKVPFVLTVSAIRGSSSPRDTVQERQLNMATMTLEIVTAEKLAYSDEVNSVVAPGIEGELGILPHHAPLLTILQPGELRIIKEGHADEYLAMSGGFMEVMNNKVVILADAAERADEIDEERAQEAVKRAEERINDKSQDLDLERTVASMRRAQLRLKVARRRRSGPRAGS